MLYIKDIFKACVCSFCENIYEYDSIDEKDFIESFVNVKIKLIEKFKIKLIEFYQFF